MRRTMIVVLFGLSAALSLPASAEDGKRAPEGIACGKHAALVAALSERYEERQVSLGLQNNGRLFELYASGKTGTWTVLSTRTDGTSCILAVGRHYEQRDPSTTPDSTADDPHQNQQGTAS